MGTHTSEVWDYIRWIQVQLDVGAERIASGSDLKSHFSLSWFHSQMKAQQCQAYLPVEWAPSFPTVVVEILGKAPLAFVGSCEGG